MAARPLKALIQRAARSGGDVPVPEPFTVPEIPVIPGLPAEFANLPSVRMVPPPDIFLPKISELLEKSTAGLGPFKHKLTWIVTDTGVNAAVVSKAIEKERVVFTYGAFFAKDWGEPISAGLMGEIKWR